MVFGQIWGTRNRREQRGRSNLGGAPAPPAPWRPRTRGGTLLPSRGEVTIVAPAALGATGGEGERAPLASGGAGVPPGAIIITAIFTNNFTAIITNSSPLYAAV